MMLQDDPEMLNYVNAKLHELAPPPGSFLKAFLEACRRADSDNYPLLMPALRIFSVKYQAHPLPLAAEEEDSGLEST